MNPEAVITQGKYGRSGALPQSLEAVAQDPVGSISTLPRECFPRRLEMRPTKCGRIVENVKLSQYVETAVCPGQR